MIKFSKNNGMIEPFTIILSNRNQEFLGEIINTQGVNFTGNFNSADELSFSVDKFRDGREERLWDDIFDLRLVYIKELNEFFQISVSMEDANSLTKTVTCTSLCEAELSQTMLYDIEINTEVDISRPDYKVAKFWTTSTDPQSAEYKSTILYRVLEKVPAYKVKHVDGSLVNLQRVFSINGTSVYDWLVGDCSTEFNCLVKFDTTDRTISFYDLYTTCPICHARGLFNDKCTHIVTQEDVDKYGINGIMPNGVTAGGVCGNTDLKYYGEDTTILVSTENLTDEIRYETDIDAVKNSFRLEAGDDDMTAAIINVNPSGSQYIFNYSPETLKDMPVALVDALNEYNDKLNEYKYSHQFDLSEALKNCEHTYQYTDYASPDNQLTVYFQWGYNNIVDKYNTGNVYANAHDGEPLKTVPSVITGYSRVMEQIYQCYDFYSFLESSMMPLVTLDGVTAETEAAKLTQSALGTVVALSSFSKSTTSATVKTALENYAKAFVKTGYVKVEWEYNVNLEDHGWTNSITYGTASGRFKVTDYNLTDENDESMVAYSMWLTFTINKQYDEFIKQKILKKLAKEAEDNSDITKIWEITDLATFESALRQYSLNRLQAFRDATEAVLGIMQEAGIATNPSEQTDQTKLDLYYQFYKPYLMKLRACEEEYNLRSNELKIIAEYYNDSMSGGLLFELLKIRNDVHKDLDLKAFLDKKCKEVNDADIANRFSQHPAYKEDTGRFTTISGRAYDKQNEGGAICGRYHRTDGYRCPIMVSDIEAAVTYVTIGHTFPSVGSFELYDKTWYYSGDDYGFSGNEIPNLGDYPTRLDAAKGLVKEALAGHQQCEFYKLLTTYTRQDTYSNRNYVSVSLNNEQLFKMAAMFYEAAYEELLKASTYQHSLSANLYNLLAIDAFKPIRNRFELGNWIRVSTDDQVYRLRLISYSVNFDDPSTLNTQFSDMTSTGVGYNDLQSLFQQANSMATSYPAVTRQAELGKLANNHINEWVEKGLNSAKTRIMNNTTEEINIGDIGVTAKTFDDVTGEYDKEQLRITHNILAFTEDNWETVSTALGKFTLTHHIPYERDESIPGVISPLEEEFYGLCAKAVLSGWIVGSTIEGSQIIAGHIQNVGHTAYIDMYTDNYPNPDIKTQFPDFIHVEGKSSKFRITKAGNFITTGGHFSDPADTMYLDLAAYDPHPDGTTQYYPYFLYYLNKFYITKEDGTIMSIGGHFQNADNTSYVDLGDSVSYSIDGSEVLVDQSNMVYFLRCKNPNIFSVTKNGYIVATSGQIGGFYIGDDYISSVEDFTAVRDAITLSLDKFTRTFNTGEPIVESGVVVGYRAGTVSHSGLLFAINNAFGIDQDGNVYSNKLYSSELLSGKVNTGEIHVNNTTEITDNKFKAWATNVDIRSTSTVNDLQIFSGKRVRINDIFIENYTIDASPGLDPVPGGEPLILPKQICIWARSGNTTHFVITEETIEKRGVGTYYVPWMSYGYGDPPLSLPTGHIYLQYEDD